ncbi:DUF4012 domain-containing protein [Nocardioides albidus]|uniref:DUF4012 domain-containing protein n=1 Tax=Nocardioides albidus TaxID=1517589 RepID=A0A5C4W7R9_9ACTN|nr:DUF4012 domain-containing protein [Nocardioides albidus]TNM44152.1 DUF4012 domain-containing protein [Nocardioides albidus]
MSRRRSLRAAVVGGGLVLVLAALWAAWQVYQVNRDLTDAVDHGRAIQAAVEARDSDALDEELEALRTSSESAADRTSGFTWSVLTKLPLVGDDARGVEVTSAVLHDLARDGVGPLAIASAQFEELLPHGGAIGVGAARRLQEPVARAERAFRTADRTLSEVDTNGFVSRLDGQFSDFSKQVSDAARALRTARLTADLMPAVLGEDGPRTYLLAFQNNAELRSTGGLPGAVAFLEADHGKISMVRQASGGSFPPLASPVLPLTDAEQDLYGDVLGTYFVDAGMTPDVPRAAELMRAHVGREYPGMRLDGVIMVDTVALSYLLDATAPVQVDGVAISGENVVDELLHKTYLRLDSVAQDAFFAEVAKQVFERMTGGVDNPDALLRGLARAAGERRLFLHLFDEDEQDRIAGTLVAGELTPAAASSRPRIDVALNDTTGSKMSYYLRTETDIRATSCVGDVQAYSAKMRLRSAAPPDAASLPADVTGGGFYGITPGTQLVTLRIFGPVGGKLAEVSWNGKPLELVHVEQDGRPVGMTYIQLDPGQVADLAWTMRSGEGQTGATALAMTPTMEKKDGARMVASACAEERG